MVAAELPQLMTDVQVAELTGLKIQTLANWRCRRVGPPFVRLGNRTVRYNREAILEWIEESTINSGAKDRN